MSDQTPVNCTCQTEPDQAEHAPGCGACDCVECACCGPCDDTFCVNRRA